MGLFDGRNPALVDLDIGLIGTFVGVSDTGPNGEHERGYVYPIYVPLNSFPPSKKIYGTAVSETAIYHVHPRKQSVDGVEKEIVFIFSGDQESVANFMDNIDKKKIKELQEKIKDMEIALTSERQRAENALSGVEKQMSRSKNANKPTIESSTPGKRYFEDL